MYRLITLLLLCWLKTFPVLAQDGFQPLFNGRDLFGWENVNCAPETWTATEGMIRCTGVPYGVLRTSRPYENFILELEFKHTVEGGNAGLFVHADALPAPGSPFPRAVECQIMEGNHGDMFAINGSVLVPDKPHPKGWTRALPAEERMKPAGEWNSYRVESNNGSLTLSVNGAVVTKAYNLNPRKGYICLESEGSEIFFRTIRIKPLPSSPPNLSPENIAAEDAGYRSLYNGLDLRNWRQIKGNEGHWRANGWILDYDGKSEASGDDCHLWTEREYGDFSLMVDWMLPGEPKVDTVPVILPDGSEMKDAAGNPVTADVMDPGDSGIYLRGSSKCQINIWNWPVGSGEIWGYRTDSAMTPATRAAATPILNADNPPGKWNRFEITVKGETVTVVLNGKTVIREAVLPGIPKNGAIALQHHGDPVKFANIYIKELK